jgi:hypothetical protein
MPKNASANEWAEILLNFKVNSVQYDGLENWDMGNVIRTLENLYTIGKS